jgi:hypothetical protein
MNPLPERQASDDVLQFLDLSIDACALVADIDPEIASFTMMAVLVAAERIGLSDHAAYRMRDSAIAAIRRRRAGD